MKKLITIIFIALAKISFGQYQIYEQLLTPYLSGPIQSGHFYFNTPNNIQAGSLYQFYRTNAPDLNNNMQLVEQHTDADDFGGFTHYKYRQTYMSIPVEAAGCIEHYDPNGSLYLINAKIADSIKKTHVPKLSDKDAIQALLDKIDTDPKIVFAWEDESWEQQIRSDQANSNATWLPTAELIWAIDEVRDVQLIIPGSRYSLAYKITINTILPDRRTTIYYIDAQTGDILKSRGQEVDMSGDVYGYGNKILDARWHGGFVQKWELIAEDNGHNIHTKKYDSWQTWDNTDEVRKADNNWLNTYLTETSTHFHVTNSWDYFYNTFGRLGLDGQGSKIKVYTQIGEQQAYFTADVGDGDYLRFGVSAGNQDFGMEPSVVAHEFTHGITRYTAGLVYEFESGALDESYSDIFGTVIQAQTLDGYTDWRLGNWIANTNISIRSLINPGQYGKHWDGTYTNGLPNFVLGQPAFYLDPYWCNCPYDVDKGGVHINSGVQNRWFFALTEGAPANPPFPGIGMTKAARIAYYALTNILMSSAQYTDSKEATITAAIILYGECSAEHKATVNAWNFADMPASYNCTLGVDEFDKEDIEIYPNPTSSIIKIKVPANLNQPLTIFDLNGKLIKQVESNQLNFEVDLSSLNKGVYLAHFLIEGQELIKRIVIQ
jgi:bacillolysin